MSRVSIRDWLILTETVKLAEEVKPSQYAKRIVFKRYGILGSPRDRFLTALYYDIMKRQGIIDKIISEVTNSPSPYILDPWLRASLRVTIEFFVFKRRLIKHSNLDEVKSGVAKFLSDKTHPYVGMYYWRLISKLLEYKYQPRNEVEKLELQYFLPAWFIEKMRKLLGEKESKKLFEALNRRPLISIRVNTLKATVNEVIEELEREGKEVKVSSVVPTILKFKGPYDFDGSKLYREGKFVIQEEAAALASIILNPKPGEKVIDMCAAPGGKTIHMAELMKNKGVIYAFDVDKARIKRMRELIRRTGVSIVKIYVEDVRNAPKILGEEVADKVMLDAPCTSDGTIAKNPELRWRIHEEKIAEYAKLQYELLETAIKLVKPGGKILYCTCSMFKEENEDLIENLLKKHPEVKLIPLHGPYSKGFIPNTMRAWPHKHNTIGFFYALLEKKK